MKYVLIFLLITNCGWCIYFFTAKKIVVPLPEEFSSCNNDELFVEITNKDDSSLFGFSREIIIQQSDIPVFMVGQSLLTTTIVFFSDSKPEKVITYDISGKQASECTIIDDKPFEGTMWSLTLGLQGIKSSTISTYKDGVIISEALYRIEKLSDIFKQLGQIRNLFTDSSLAVSPIQARLRLPKK